ncbi:cytochrome C [Massilia sp. METH4]|uniref:c-type cytochrome n=1 Tax=Massilia sp. METH4 TaxID=3123041 RepID=UPI0030CDE232
MNMMAQRVRYRRAQVCITAVLWCALSVVPAAADETTVRVQESAAQPPTGRYAMALPLHPTGPAKTATTQTLDVVKVRAMHRLYCAGCHQLDGSGVPASGVPDMRGTLGHFQRTPAGRAFLIQAPGARNSQITDAELAALTNWQLREFSPTTLPPDFKPYTAEEVSGYRANPPLDVTAVRGAIAAGFPKPP